MTCEYPDVGEELLYVMYLDDSYMGSFENEKQREYYLKEIGNKILEKLE